MISSDSVPWYNVPARPFPARVWLERYYPFRISPAIFARPTGWPAGARRPFPARVWLAQQSRVVK